MTPPPTLYDGDGRDSEQGASPGPCLRCAVLEDLLETATSERDKARDEAAKADDEARAHKVEMLRLRATGSSKDYALIKEFQRRAEKAEAALARATPEPQS